MIRIATRNSALAKAQAGWVAASLGEAELVEVSSDGEVGDKGRFVRGVERALLEGEADIGVHSAKDLPGEMAVGLTIAAVPAREDAADVWIGMDGGKRAHRPGDETGGAAARPALETVPEEARVGTASLRRQAQLLAARPDLRVGELHGNVDTRLRKLAEGEFDAIVLAAAGLRRLGRSDEATFSIGAATMTPAAGQGALVLQAREGDDAALEAAAAIGDETALRELTAERAAVGMLDATCATPVGVNARASDADGATSSSASLIVEAFVGLPDGSEWIRDRVEAEAADPGAAGALLAERLLAAGAREILNRAETMA